MKRKIFLGLIVATTIMLTYSCSNDETVERTVEEVSTLQSSPEFVAKLSEEQKFNAQKTGEVFLQNQQRDAFNATIDKNVPTRYGLYSIPQTETRAVGIWGSYPAQYWTMIRLRKAKNLGGEVLASHIRRAINEAVSEIEHSTNVRFYNSEGEAEVLPGYNIKLPNVSIGYDLSKYEGTGSFGLVGGEQFISIPQIFNEEKYKSGPAYRELVAFLLHAFCNAAGMFNEQQRPDRDEHVTIYWDNIKDDYKTYFEKCGRNYIMNGSFDKNSITIASSKAYSKNGAPTIKLIGGGEILKNQTLSDSDKFFLNQHYLPYIARKDTYTELDSIVYFQGRRLTEEERLRLQNYLNQQRGLYGEPPADGRSPQRKLW